MDFDNDHENNQNITGSSTITSLPAHNLSISSLVGTKRKKTNN